MHVACKDLSTGSDRDLHRLAAFQNLSEMYTIFKNGGMFLPRQQARRARECIDEFFGHWAWLLHYNIDRGELNYPINFKLHSLYHIADLSCYLNPTYTWAYEWEHFMHVVIRAAKACMAGSRMAIIGNEVMQNFYLVMDLHIRLEDNAA